MRRMAFSMTTAQFRARTKTVTRRQAWWDLPTGTHLMAVEKGMGLKKGEKQVLLGPIEIVSVRQEPVGDITQEDVVREGFPGWTCREFINFYCNGHRCQEEDPCNRIEFRRLD